VPFFVYSCLELFACNESPVQFSELSKLYYEAWIPVFLEAVAPIKSRRSVFSRQHDPQVYATPAATPPRPFDRRRGGRSPLSF